MLKCVLLSLSLLGLTTFELASGQQSFCAAQWGKDGVSNIMVDDPKTPSQAANGVPLGGEWRLRDFPKNSTTQDFSQLGNNPSNYIYIPNTVPVGLNMYNQHWLPQNLTDKLDVRPRVRPEGFKYSEISPLNNKYPCVEILGVAGYGVEIMVYALLDVEICIRHRYEVGSLNAQSAQLFNDICGQQRLQHCFIAPDYYGTRTTNNVGFEYEIYVRTQDPPDYTVPVFYRSRHSQYPYKDQGSQLSSGNTEMWCMMISGSVETSYPEFASVVPPNIRIPATNSAGRINAFETFVRVLGVTLFFALFGW